MINISRQHPHTCNCTIERITDSEDPTGAANFLMMSFICDDHFHLASVTHKSDHKQKSDNALKIVEAIKKRNKDNAEARRNEPHIKRSKKLSRELEISIQGVYKHNDDITEEWSEYVQPPFAYDDHIFATVMDEVQLHATASNAALKHAVDNNLAEVYRIDEASGTAMLKPEVAASFMWEGKAPNRTLHYNLDKLSDNHKSAIQQKINHPRIKIG